MVRNNRAGIPPLFFFQIRGENVRVVFKETMAIFVRTHLDSVDGCESNDRSNTFRVVGLCGGLFTRRTD